MDCRIVAHAFMCVAMISMASAAANAQANGNPPNSLCLELRNALPANAQGTCMSDDDECNAPIPDGILQCSDNDLDPMNGGICVDQACYLPGAMVVIDVELGPTLEPVCGAQFFLEWIVDSVALISVVVDPDNEFEQDNPGFTFILAQATDGVNGMLDVAIALPPDTPCDRFNGTTTGGTLARLTFAAMTRCKNGLVDFRPHNPPSYVAGASGDLLMIGCNGSLVPSGSDEFTVESEPEWDCPESSSGFADCGKVTREVLFDPIAVESCDPEAEQVESLCTVEYFPLCSEDQDCAAGRCAGVFCTEPVIPPGVDLNAYLDGGGEFLPGQTVISCTLTSACALTGSCQVIIENLTPHTDSPFTACDDCASVPAVSAPGMSVLCAVLLCGLILSEYRRRCRPAPPPV